MHVAVLDVPAVFAQMDGDAVGARAFAYQGGFHGVWLAVSASPVTGFAEGGDVIDVHSEFQHQLITAFSARAQQKSGGKTKCSNAKYGSRCNPLEAPVWMPAL
jgi:hypothetical protein